MNFSSAGASLTALGWKIPNYMEIVYAVNELLGLLGAVIFCLWSTVCGRV